MLQITIPATEEFDERTNEFSNSKEQVLQLEHSLISLSKWESKHCKPFLVKGEKPNEETIDYIRCMTLTQNVPDIVYLSVSNQNIKEVAEYIDAPMTATTFSKDDSNVINREIITSEIIYYWMVALNIPFECQKWHLNRLITLIRVCSIKNQPTKKMKKSEVLAQQRSINEARKAALHTSG